MHDPDGHEVHFYTLQHHDEFHSDAGVVRVEDPRETAEARERAVSESATQG